ncbi:SHOCT domain-containing protein [Pedococcus sp. KACC 23699]|uniref:SHOCT domain-containing protein n=1 Tax=Pedococcus sp. KACC 23699 TaxID=3149228 RepID=A0AAU7JT48_9MICO
MSFWDVVWFIVITYVFVAYLMMLWAIVKDLFRDEQASGFTKALWVIALIVLPILAACVYVISKSGQMTQREMASRADAMRQQEAYIKEVAGRPSASDQLASAKSMLDSGTITEAEYERLKNKALT